MEKILKSVRKSVLERSLEMDAEDIRDHLYGSYKDYLDDDQIEMKRDAYVEIAQESPQVLDQECLDECCEDIRQMILSDICEQLF